MPAAKLLTAIQDKSLLYQDMVIQGINQFHGTTLLAFLVIVLIEPDVLTMLGYAI